MPGTDLVLQIGRPRLTNISVTKLGVLGVLLCLAAMASAKGPGAQGPSATPGAGQGVSPADDRGMQTIVDEMVRSFAKAAESNVNALGGLAGGCSFNKCRKLYYALNSERCRGVLGLEPNQSCGSPNFYEPAQTLPFLNDRPASRPLLSRSDPVAAEGLDDRDCMELLQCKLDCWDTRCKPIVQPVREQWEKLDALVAPGLQADGTPRMDWWMQGDNAKKVDQEFKAFTAALRQANSRAGVPNEGCSMGHDQRYADKMPCSLRKFSPKAPPAAGAPADLFPEQK